MHVVMGLRLGHGHSNREGQNGVPREVALGPPAKAAVLALELGLVIKPQQLPRWHAEPLLYLKSKHGSQSCSITVLEKLNACNDSSMLWSAMPGEPLFPAQKASAYLVIFDKKLVNRKGPTVHSTVQIEKSAFRKLLNGS